jgi:hypothetical protein
MCHSLGTRWVDARMHREFWRGLSSLLCGFVQTLAESTELGVDSLIAAVHLTMADIANTAADVADKQVGPWFFVLQLFPTC